jgi:uncharacterized repeat protein (TIGR02543 family)
MIKQKKLTTITISVLVALIIALALFAVFSGGRVPTVQEATVEASTPPPVNLPTPQITATVEKMPWDGLLPVPPGTQLPTDYCHQAFFRLNTYTEIQEFQIEINGVTIPITGRVNGANHLQRTIFAFERTVAQSTCPVLGFVDDYGLYTFRFRQITRAITLPGMPITAVSEWSDPITVCMRTGRQITISLPGDPTPPAGYVFRGWYSDAAFTQPFTGQVTGDMHLFARFERIKIATFVTVTFMVNGEVYREVTVVAGTFLHQLVRYVSLAEHEIFDANEAVIENIEAMTITEDMVFHAFIEDTTTGGGGSNSTTIVPNVPDVATYIVGGVLGVIIFGAIAYGIKKAVKG